MTSTNAQRTPKIVGLLVALAVAVLVRGIGLEGQVLTDDELHTVHAALVMPAGEIVRTWTFDGADYGVPTTLLHRFAMDRGVVFSELTFRWPSIAAGLIAVFLLPWIAAPRIGSRAALGLAWLVAVSPMLSVYSRMVRPYMVTALLLGCAALLFDRWFRDRSRASATGCVLTASFAVYSHLAALPAVAGIFLFGVLRLGRRPSAALPVVGLAAATGLLVGLLLLPAWESLVEVVQTTRDGHLPTAATWWSVTRLQVGSLSGWVAVLVAVVAARGIFVLWKRERDFIACLASVVAAQILGLVLLAPDRLEEPIVLNRYVLVVLPLALIPLAVGATERWWPGTSRLGRTIEAVVAVAALALLVLSGPFVSGERVRGSFEHSLTSVDFLGRGNRMAPADVPRFYREIASKGEAPVIEYPWQNMAFHAFDAYQRIHGRPVRVSSVIDRRDETRLALRNRVEPSPDSILGSPARYIVVHLDLHSETRRIESSDPHLSKWLGARKQLWAPLRRAGNAMALELRLAWGPPSYDDGVIEVWDLDAVRGAKGLSP